MAHIPPESLWDPYPPMFPDYSLEENMKRDRMRKLVREDKDYREKIRKACKERGLGRDFEARMSEKCGGLNPHTHIPMEQHNREVMERNRIAGELEVLRSTPQRLEPDPDCQWSDYERRWVEKNQHSIPLNFKIPILEQLKHELKQWCGDALKGATCR